MELYMFGIFTGMIISLMIFSGGVVYADFLDKREHRKHHNKPVSTDMDNRHDRSLDRHNKPEVNNEL